MSTASNDWSAVVDESTGQTYYFNSATNETSWTIPEGVTPAASASVALSPGWAAVVDETTKQTYYYNSETNETRWTVPEDDSRDSHEVKISEGISDRGRGALGGGGSSRDKSPSGRERSPSASLSRGLARSLSRTTSSSSSKQGKGVVQRQDSKRASVLSNRKSLFLGGGKKSSSNSVGARFGAGSSLGGFSEEGGGDGQGGGEDGEEGEESDGRPDEQDHSFEAKETRFRLFEGSVKQLVLLVELHHGSVLNAFTQDAAFATEAVRFAGCAEPELRKSAASSWAGSVAAGSVASAYANDVGTCLLAAVKADLMTFEKVDAAIKERQKADKDFSHYVGKLAELRVKQQAEKKPDAKKLARNQQKYDEAMLSLEVHTQTCVELFTAVEQRREALVTKDFLAWQRAQHEHLPQLIAAFKDGGKDAPSSSAAPTGMSRRSFHAESCPIQGLDKHALAMANEASSASAHGGGGGGGGDSNSSAGSVSVVAQTKSSWSTNIRHRLKYGAAADFAATDEEMEKAFTDEALFFAEFERSLPVARKCAEAFVRKVDEAFRVRVDLDEAFLRVCGLPKGGDDESRLLTDFERFSSYDSEQLTVGQVAEEVEVRMDSDIDCEDLLEATVLRFQADVLQPLDDALLLFKQPTVLDMLRERPKLVASVNHYKAKMKDLEKSLEELKGKQAGSAAVRASAQKKLEGNQGKHDAEVEKLKHLTTQLVHSFGLIEQQSVEAVATSSSNAFECKCDLATHLGAAAKEITAHELVSGGGGGRASVGGGRRTRKRGASTAGMKSKPYDPNQPSRKELLRKGLGTNGLPLKLSDLRFEQAVTLQASLRRLTAAKRHRKQRRAAVKLQARLRGFSSKRHLLGVLKWVTAQQALARGVSVRTAVKAQIAAAVKIQRAYGGFKIKAKFKNSIGQVVRTQSAARGGLVRAKVRKWNRSALAIQKCQRGETGRSTALKHQWLVVRVQSAARRWLCRQKLARAHSSASRVQSHVRRTLQAKRFAAAVKHVVLVQSLGRRKCAHAYLVKLHAGASALQAVLYGLKARQLLARAKGSATVLQAVFRGVLVRQGKARRFVRVRYFKLLWPDLSLPEAGVSSSAHASRRHSSCGGGSGLGQGKSRRGSMGDLFAGAERRMSTALVAVADSEKGSADNNGEALMSNPMARASSSAKGGAKGGDLKKNMAAAGSGVGGGRTKPQTQCRVQEQLMLFDDKMLSIVSTRSFLRIVASRRRLFVLHKAAAFIQAMSRTRKQTKGFKAMRQAAVVFQALLRTAFALRSLRAKKRAVKVVQKWVRQRSEQGAQWRTMLAKARETANKALSEKSNTQSDSARLIQKQWKRRRYLRTFVHAVASFLVKRERKRLESLQGRSAREEGCALKVQAWARGAVLVRHSSDEKFFPESRKSRSYKGLMSKNKNASDEEEDMDMDQALSEAAEAAQLVSSGVRGKAKTTLLSSAAKARRSKPAPKAMKRKAVAAVPPPRFHARKGRFQHFRAAVVVIQTFARRVAVLHKLFSKGTIAASLAWRSQRAQPAAKTATARPGLRKGHSFTNTTQRKRLGAHKLPWYRGHGGVVTVTGNALRSIGLLGFCKLVIVRRKLYQSECAAVCIQAAWRRYREVLSFHCTLSAVVQVQAASRCRAGWEKLRRFKQVREGFERLGNAKKLLRTSRGIALASPKLLALATRAKEAVLTRRRLTAAAVLRRLAKTSKAKTELGKGVARWKKAKQGLCLLQAKVRAKPLAKKWRQTRKAGKVLSRSLIGRHRAWRLRCSLLQVVRLAAQGGGSGGGNGKEALAAFRIQKWWNDVGGAQGEKYRVGAKAHKRVLKAGLKFKTLVAQLKTKAEEQLMEVKELQLELRVTRKHSEETSRMASERADKMIEQQMTALQQMQQQTSAVSDMGQLQVQLDAFRSGIVSEMNKNLEASGGGGGGSGGGGGGGGGLGGEDMKRLYRRIEKQEDDLSENRKKIDSLEATRDDFKAQLNKANRSNKSFENELFGLKKRYMEQRGINAKLMLEVQGLKGNIQVCCRIRPFNQTETDRGDEAAVELITETEVGVIDKSMDWETYGFDQVWGSQSTQASIFEQVEALALSVVDGFNACICCYGQTGSGKTFTMTGLPRDGKPGISFQTMDKVFEMLELKRKAAEANLEALERVEQNEAERRAKVAQRGGAELSAADKRPPPPGGSASKVTSFEWSAEVSMLEIYNEEVRCLLTPAPSKRASTEPKTKLEIKQGKDGLMTVPGLVATAVEDTPGVLDAFELGNSTRSVSATAMNATSSRSHMVLMVDVTTRTNGGAAVTGRLYLVDLAGSERVAKSGVTGQAMKEAQGINKSLSALGDVMEALDKGQGHIPFRNSKLTFLLQSALGGSARCMFIFNASPADGNSEETRCTFKFASRMRNISLGAAKKNVDASGLEELLGKAKAEARQANAEMGALKAQVKGMAGQQSGGSKAAGEQAKKLEMLEGEVALAEQEAAAAADEVASLRDRLAESESLVRELKEAGAAPGPVVPRRRASQRSQSPAQAAAAKDDQPGGSKLGAKAKSASSLTSSTSSRVSSVKPRPVGGRGGDATSSSSAGGRTAAPPRPVRASTGTAAGAKPASSSRSPPRSSTGSSAAAGAKPLRRTAPARK